MSGGGRPILANIVVWGIMALGGFFLATYKDWTMALALAQLATKVNAFQWIFAFVIMVMLFLVSAVVAAPVIFGVDRSVRQDGAVVREDSERKTLLDVQA